MKERYLASWRGEAETGHSAAPLCVNTPPAVRLCRPAPGGDKRARGLESRNAPGAGPEAVRGEAGAAAQAADRGDSDPTQMCLPGPAGEGNCAAAAAGAGAGRDSEITWV